MSIRKSHSAADSGLNRRTRRRLERGSAFVHLFSGVQRWDHPGHTPSLSLDLQRGFDLHDDALYWYLLQLARRGDISYLLGGPPCRTFTALRARAEGEMGDGGPRILRSREGMHRFGLSGLSATEQGQADGDSVLVLRTLLLAEVASEGLRAKKLCTTGIKNARLFFGLEHPEDPREFLDEPEGRGWPTIWAWPEVQAFAKRHEMFEASFHQGMLGHLKVKPTKMLLSSGYLWERLHMLKVPKGSLWRPSESSALRQRVQTSAGWAEWAPQLVAYIRESMLEWQKGETNMQLEDDMRNIKLQQIMADMGVECQVPDRVGFLRKARKGDVEAFRRHCMAGHKPWRSDCAACLDSMAYSRPHRRLRKSRACALSVDITGPFRTEGAEDQEVSRPKYLLVGAYTFPVFGSADDQESKDHKIPSPEELEAVEPEPCDTERPEFDDETEAWEIPEEEPASRALTAPERKRLEDENKRWETIMAACKDTNYTLVEIPMVEVLSCKSTHAVIGGLNRFYAKLRFLGLPVYRLRSDCAGEFTHGTLRQWANHRGIHVTTTMPESKASNGRAERLVGRLKQRIRVLLNAHRVGPAFWPHAARYAAEDMQRTALRHLGHEVPALVPFHSLVRFRSRTWRDSAWGSRATEGRLVAPCTDISKGYIIRVLDKDVVRYYATTLVYRDFQEPVPEPEVEGPEAVATEVHPTRFEPGWPPPPGAGDIQSDPPFEEVSEEVPIPAYPEPKGISPYLPPTRRTRTKSPGTLRKVTRVADLEVHPAGPPRATPSAEVEHMSQEQKQVQAKILANASFDGLNRSRVAAILEQVRGLGLGPFDLQLAPLACCDVHCDISKLLAAVLQKGTVPWLRCCCSIQRGDVKELLQLVATRPSRSCYVLPLTDRDMESHVWMPLKRGSLVQGELCARPDQDPATAELGQACELIGWRALFVTDACASCVVGPSASLDVLWLLVELPAARPMPALHTPSEHVTAVRACGPGHSQGSWGESPHADSPHAASAHIVHAGTAPQGAHVPTQGAEQPKTMQVHRWFHNLPLPEVEPVDQNLLYYDNENEDRAFGLEGMRLATLAAIRDQEMALARELQEGHRELAKFTAENISDLNKMVESLEETLCALAHNIPEMYEEQGPQNRDVMLKAVSPEEGNELLQAKVIPVSEVCEHIEQWRDAIGEEVQSVINKHKAGTFRSEAEVRALESEGKYQVIRVPGKLVAAIKPPRRFKARLVACANFLRREKTRKSSTLDRTDLYCSNLDIFSLRIQIAVGVQKGWRAASIDVKTALLTAPFQAGRTTGPEPKQKLILVKVPRAVVLAGFAEPNSYIQVDKALYGLQESPHS